MCFKVLLINAVKDVASALADLISATKNASGKNVQDTSMSTLKDSAKVCARLICFQKSSWFVFKIIYVLLGSFFSTIT